METSYVSSSSSRSSSRSRKVQAATMGMGTAAGQESQLVVMVVADLGWTCRLRDMACLACG